MSSNDSSDVRFAAHLAELVGVIGHADRAAPLRDYCTGLHQLGFARQSHRPRHLLAQWAAPAGVALDRVASRREGAHEILALDTTQVIDFERMVELAKPRWRIERDYQDFKQELGLGHDEGRGWRGFHHHASLCIAAYG